MKRTKTLQLLKRNSQKQPGRMPDQIWLKRVLVPLWVIVLLWCIAVLVISSIDLCIVSEYESESGEIQYRDVVEYVHALDLFLMGY